MQSYSQRDPRWAGKLLGDSALTVGRFGCTTTGIADLSTFYGDNFDPGQAVGKIKYSNGLVIWGSCQFPHFKFWFREHGRNDTNIRNAIAGPDTAVLLNVAGGSHWVVAIGAGAPGEPYRIADPWIGDRADMSRYNNDITGAAYFKRV